MVSEPCITAFSILELKGIEGKEEVLKWHFEAFPESGY